METETATYTTRPATNGHGTFFYPSCCHERLYSIKDKWAYDGALCPACYSNGFKKVILRLHEDERNDDRDIDEKTEEITS